MSDDEAVPDDVYVLEKPIPAGRYLKLAGVARRLGLTSEGVRWLADVGRLSAVQTPLGRIYTEGHVLLYLRKKAELWPHNRRPRL